MPRLDQKQMEVLSREDVKRVLSVCGIRDRALVMTLIDSGIRRGEALDLTWEDADFRTGAVHVRRGKGRKARVTYVGAKTKKERCFDGAAAIRAAVSFCSPLPAPPR